MASPEFPGLFAEVASMVGVELCWRQWREERHPTYLLHSVAERLPVAWVRLNRDWWYFPTQIRCRAFRGTIRAEWQGGRPSLLGLLHNWLLEIFEVRGPYRQFNALRSDDDNGIIAIYEVQPFRTFEKWRAEITVHDTVYQMREEHLPPLLKIIHTGDKITAFDGNGDVVTAVVYRGRPKCGRITILRAVEGVEAVLAFLFMKARELELDTSD